MRPSKNLHLITELRSRLGLNQKGFAEELGMHERSIRAVEIGARRLSWQLAQRIGDAFNVDPYCLMKNDLAKGLRSLDGRPWSKKIQAEIQDRLKKWGKLAPFAKTAQRGIAASLFYQYLQISHVIRALPEPEDRLRDWIELFHLALDGLMWSQRSITDNWTLRDEQPFADLETVLDDLRAVLSDRELVERVKKRARAKTERKFSELDLMKKTFAGRFGWGQRGLIAARVIEELGFERAAAMHLSELDARIQARCQKEGISWRLKFDAFRAIKKAHQEEQEFERQHSANS